MACSDVISSCTFLMGCLAVFFSLFTRHGYPPGEKLFAVLVFAAGLSLRWISDRSSIAYASGESVRLWTHGFSRLYSPSKRFRGLVAVDETAVEVDGCRCYLWAATGVDSGEVLAVYASRGRSILNALSFLKRVLKTCENRPAMVVDRGLWCPWALRRLGQGTSTRHSGEKQDREVVQRAEGGDEEIPQRHER